MRVYYSILSIFFARFFRQIRGEPRQQSNPRYDQRRNEASTQRDRGQTVRRPPAKLRKTKNKWPRSKREQSKAKKHLVSVKKAARSILDKLFVDNFEQLLLKFLDLDIRTKKQLEAVIETIVDKAIHMPAHCHLCAVLCGQMNNLDKMFCDKIVKILKGHTFDTWKFYYYDVGDDERTPGVEGPYEESEQALAVGTKKCAFKRLLLDHCQRVFKEAFVNVKDPRRLGIVQFIAHLFLNSLISDKPVHACMRQLMQLVDEELQQDPPVTDSVECFAKVIAEIGEAVDRGKNRHLMDTYMHYLKTIVKVKDMDSRTRSVIMEVINLREKYNWVYGRSPLQEKTKQVKILLA